MSVLDHIREAAPWNGHARWECAFPPACAFDSLDKDTIIDHVREAHLMTLPPPPVEPEEPVDMQAIREATGTESIGGLAPVPTPILDRPLEEIRRSRPARKRLEGGN